MELKFMMLSKNGKQNFFFKESLTNWEQKDKPSKLIGIYTFEINYLKILIKIQ